MIAEQLSQFKRSVREGWAAGDFPSVARRELWPVGQRIVDRVGVQAGERVLDVACGTGNVALRAAQAGGRVVGLDLTPELLDVARRLAAEAGVEVDWREGDVESLPFEDESFDIVLSTFGVMFAPRHAVAAREIARVLRPGGRMALCNWSADSVVSRSLRAVGRYLPPLPDFASPPVLWGSEEHVRSLFSGSGLELEFERGEITFPPFESAEADIDYHASKVGVLMKARARAESEGRWPELRAELAALHQGSTSSDSYLVVLGRKLSSGAA